MSGIYTCYICHLCDRLNPRFIKFRMESDKFLQQFADLISLGKELHRDVFRILLIIYDGAKTR